MDVSQISKGGTVNGNKHSKCLTCFYKDAYKLALFLLNKSQEKQMANPKCSSSSVVFAMEQLFLMCFRVPAASEKLDFLM